MEEINIIKKDTSTPYNTYDSALKQLVHILKSKSADNLKHLEELWDSINKEIKPTRNSPTPSGSSQSPITSMSDNSNDSISSINLNLKREYSKYSNEQDSQIIPKKARTEIKAIKKTIKPKIETDCSMLDDFTCVICKQFNQELNNKLVECRKCTSLYHQLCHIPRIRDEEIDEKDIEECATCKNESTSSDTDVELSPTITKSVNPVRLQTNIFTNLSNNNQAVDKKPQPISNTNGFKGLAGLATKFNGSNSFTDNKIASKPLVKSPEQPVKLTNELFKKTKPATLNSTSSISSSGKIKNNSSVISNGIQKKSGLFSLSNGIKSSFASSLKEKKHLNSSGGIQSNAPSINNSIARSKIS